MHIDLHADTPLLMHWLGYRFGKRHRPLLPAGALFGHVDLPRMQEGGLDAQLFGLVTLPVETDPLGTIHAMIDRLEAAERETDGGFALARTATALREAHARGAKVGMLSIEGVHPLRGRLERAEDLAARGVVSFGLAHFHANEACFPAAGMGKNNDQGLTGFGRELVELVGHRGGLVDLVHVNRKGFFDAVDHATGPVFVSHTGVRGAHQHWRNLDDDQIRAVADRGGVVGIMFARTFLGGSGIDAVVGHIQHLIRVGGESVAALGSDFDGFIVPVRGLSDITGLPALREALGRANLPARAVDGVMGGNALAFFEQGLA